MKKLYASTILASGFVFSVGALAQEALPAIDVGAAQPFQLGESAVGEQKGAVDLRPPTPRNTDNRPDADPKNGQLRRRDDLQPPDGDFREGNARSSGQYRRRRQQRNHRDRAKRAEHLCARLRSLAGSLTVDGVRVYLPVDNRLDYARFTDARHRRSANLQGLCVRARRSRTAWAAPSTWSRASRCARWKANCRLGTNLAETAHTRACNPRPISARSSKIITPRSAAHGAT